MGDAILKTFKNSLLSLFWAEASGKFPSRCNKKVIVDDSVATYFLHGPLLF
jgi:hypothetical protein